MLVPEDNVSKKKKKVKELLLCKPFSILPAGGPLLTLRNGVKVYFNEYIVWKTGKLTDTATPGVKFLKQSSLPTDIKIYMSAEGWTEKYNIPFTAPRVPVAPALSSPQRACCQDENLQFQGTAGTPKPWGISSSWRCRGGGMRMSPLLVSFWKGT